MLANAALEVLVHLRIPLHEPEVICKPFVIVLPTQLLMKLFVDVRDNACPASAAPTSSLPSTVEPFCTASLESVREVSDELELAACTMVESATAQKVCEKRILGI